MTNPSFSVDSTRAAIHSFPFSFSTTAIDLIDESDVCPYPHQVAGHGLGTERHGILQYRQSILKPLSSSIKGYIEQAFYSYMHKPSLPHTLLPFRSFIPAYHGMACIVSNTSSSPFFDSSSSSSSSSIISPSRGSLPCYLKLSNLTADFIHPCILDLKLGQQTFDEDATVDKRTIEINKYRWQHETGIRVVGMKVWAEEERDANKKENEREEEKEAEGRGRYLQYGKEWGRNVPPHQLEDALRLFLRLPSSASISASPASSSSPPCSFLSSPSSPSVDTLRMLSYVLSGFLNRISSLLHFFHKQTHFRFYATSLLLIYEGHSALYPSLPSNVDLSMEPSSCCQPASGDWVKLGMIDFGHVFGAERDRVWLPNLRHQQQREEEVPEVPGQRSWQEDEKSPVQDQNSRIDVGCIHGLTRLRSHLQSIADSIQKFY